MHIQVNTTSNNGLIANFVFENKGFKNNQELQFFCNDTQSKICSVNNSSDP